MGACVQRSARAGGRAAEGGSQHATQHAAGGAARGAASGAKHAPSVPATRYESPNGNRPPNPPTPGHAAAMRRTSSAPASMSTPACVVPAVSMARRTVRKCNPARKNIPGDFSVASRPMYATTCAPERCCNVDLSPEHTCLSVVDVGTAFVRLNLSKSTAGLTTYVGMVCTRLGTTETFAAALKSRQDSSREEGAGYHLVHRHPFFTSKLANFSYVVL